MVGQELFQLGGTVRRIPEPLVTTPAANEGPAAGAPRGRHEGGPDAVRPPLATCVTRRAMPSSRPRSRSPPRPPPHLASSQAAPPPERRPPSRRRPPALPAGPGRTAARQR